MAEKKLPPGVEAKRALIDPQAAVFSIREQCARLGLNRSTYYYTPAQESPENLQLMRLLDAQYLRTPFYGYRRMTAYLHKAGYVVNHKRVQRLLQLMGLQTIYPRPRTTIPAPGHQIYPYL